MTLSVAVISIHPGFVRSYGEFGAFRAAIAAGSLTLDAIDLRDFAIDKHASVDDAPYGGGDGMVMRADVLSRAVKAQIPTTDTSVDAGGGQNTRKVRVIATAPGAKQWTQDDAKRLAESTDKLIFVCGRFAGMDQRFLDRHVDEQFSIGDFVVSGGELPVLSMIDSIVRFLPGALGNAASAMDDSFGPGMAGLLEYPLYTRPPEFDGERVPEVLLSGDHKAIREWRLTQARKRTMKLRPDLLPKK